MESERKDGDNDTRDNERVNDAKIMELNPSPDPRSPGITMQKKEKEKSGDSDRQHAKKVMEIVKG